MPRIWSRATRTRLCGGCGADIATGEVLLEIQLPQPLSRPKVRCGACAAVDGHAPPTIVVPVTTPPERVRLRIVTTTHHDWRQRAADPGDAA